ncbi:LytR/AlgR family response regulator transcription factor [Clostridium septicum]|uniref:Stage 0 sporulation protein A homolog n=1 Tax=Clostridium septicum TaxID=1504 RepID=A0A9N7JLE7_CLOSE|nr:LytTR family DNA-binding domain-containing protein [Clostridium septicum]AYE34085.1 DNA-binding response regulator [Clostridium septicum]MDU1313524.1 LytTR family DNA-binding domain-containing protein [Clostridium septicum]QAS59455.1 response regulator transcription factor [Clostridium septicum]UEC21292.1 LytTR family DNA-binding domain-containing protein [Clostridium septicum]USS00664.1 LytTR family DNA-binding domain-containing protein [Clostridium septicum]
MYSIAICEDNSIQLDSLNNILKKFSIDENIKINIDMFSTGEDLLEHGFNSYDIIILDIKMGNLTGIEVAKIIREVNKSIKIIFLTALESHWSDGYTVNAFRYILKPLNADSFYNEIKELINELNKSKIFIPIDSNGTIKKISISDILYLEILDRKVLIHTNSDIYTSTNKLKYWNDMLSPLGFSNPHNSFLVNLNYVKELNKNNVVLCNGDTIYASQRKFKSFKKDFMNFLSRL